MKQSRIVSFMEALTNVGIGIFVALATQLLLFRLLGIGVTASQTFAITMAFTAVSVLRSYLVRRLFERLRVRWDILS